MTILRFLRTAPIEALMSSRAQRGTFRLIEAQLAALESERHVMIDAFVLAHASELLR